MVDAEDLRLGKDFADILVDLLCAGQVAPERLFQHHARLVVCQPGRSEVLADVGEQAGRRGQVEHAGETWIAPHGVCQGGIGRQVVGVQRNIGDAVAEGFPQGSVEILLRYVRPCRLVDGVEELGSGRFMPANADQARCCRQVLGAVAGVECRQQLAHGEVATAAEQHEVKIG